MTETITKTEQDLPMLVTMDDKGNIAKIEIIDRRSELFHKLESARKENAKLGKRIGSQRRKITAVRERKNQAERLLRKLFEQTPSSGDAYEQEVKAFLAYTDKREPIAK